MLELIQRRSGGAVGHVFVPGGPLMIAPNT